jgi:hypothetical protein
VVKVAAGLARHLQLRGSATKYLLGIVLGDYIGLLIRNMNKSIRNMLSKMKRQHSSGISKNFLNACCLVSISVGISVGLLELGYRLQIIDFYKAELVSYNRPTDLVGEPGMPKTLLILGDSLGAGERDVYPVYLREALPNDRIINSSIRGTGSIEACLIAPRRFSQFKPQVFIYQIYVGNDLFDIRHATDYGKINLIRWVYWNASNHLQVIEFLNYRLGQISALNALMNKLRGQSATISKADLMAPFSKELHSHRERMIFSADSLLLDETINLKGRRREDFFRLIDNVREIVNSCPLGRCQIFVLVVPHKVQVSREYARQYELLGATFANKDTLMDIDYPFVRELQTFLSDRQNLLVINPLAKIQEMESKGTKLYLVNDEHMTSAGQALLAQSLLDVIRN